MTVLHLGVIDVPYSASSFEAGTKNKPLGQARRGKANTPHNNSPGTQTTGEVAEILEERYHIMETFFEDVGAELIGDALAQSVGNAIENLVMGAPSTVAPFAEAESEIETAFKLFLSQQEMDNVVPGVPTQAAQEGVSHRFRHPYAKRAPRPSFIDTGLYQANFKAWVD